MPQPVLPQRAEQAAAPFSTGLANAQCSIFNRVKPCASYEMNRKWRTNREALDTVQAYPVFRQSIPPRDAEYSLADPTDLYAVYTVLHIERKQAELRWSSHGRFYYFLAQWEQPIGGDGTGGTAAAPEGDEDPPPQIVPEGSEAALQLAATAQQAAPAQQGKPKKQKQQGQQQRDGQSDADGGSAAGGSHQQQEQRQAAEQARQQQQQQKQLSQQQQQQQQQSVAEQPAAAAPADGADAEAAPAEAGGAAAGGPNADAPGAAGAAAATLADADAAMADAAPAEAAPAAADAAPAAAEAAPAAAAADAAAAAAGAAAAAAADAAAVASVLHRLRTQIVVPVSSAYTQLTPQLLQRLFSVRGVQAQQLLLGMVDSNGVVTRSCLYNYIQAPLEGPGTANLELLDD